MFSLGSMLLEGGGTSVFTTFQSRNCKALHALPSGGLGGGGGWSGGMLPQKSFKVVH